MKRLPSILQIEVNYYGTLKLYIPLNYSVGVTDDVVLLQTVASKLHNTEVRVDILHTKAECDHVQFLITEESHNGRIAPPTIEEIETLSLGQYIPAMLASPKLNK